MITIWITVVSPLRSAYHRSQSIASQFLYVLSRLLKEGLLVILEVRCTLIESSEASRENVERLRLVERP